MINIQKILTGLRKMFDDWGIDPVNWFLLGRWTWWLHDYPIWLNKPGPTADFVVYARRSVIPWKIIEKKFTEIYPNENTKYQKDMQKFMKMAKSSLHIYILPDKDYDFWQKNYVVWYTLNNSQKIKIMSNKGSIITTGNFIGKDSKKSGVGIEKCQRLYNLIKNARDIAFEKKDQKILKLADEVLDKHRKILSNKSYEKYYNMFENDGIIKGHAISGSLASGPVKIIADKEMLNVSEINNGQIIVTTQTTPVFSKIVGKISALITDEGGITCHAVILAREFNIPCIVGTKIATKVLKDGDMVEVNADKGIIKKYGDPNLAQPQRLRG